MKKWRICNGYLCVNVKKYGRVYTKVYAHRFIMGENVKMVDHINGNRLDNRRCNLRETDFSKNRANAKINKNRRFKGVKKNYNKYAAVIRIDGRNYHLGQSRTEEGAAELYNIIAKEWFGNHARLNIL